MSTLHRVAVMNESRGVDPESAPECPDCNHPLLWEPDHGAWYCWSCDIMWSADIEVMICPRCLSEMTLDQRGVAWFCECETVIEAPGWKGAA